MNAKPQSADGFSGVSTPKLLLGNYQCHLSGKTQCEFVINHEIIKVVKYANTDKRWLA